MWPVFVELKLAVNDLWREEKGQGEEELQDLQEQGHSNLH